MKFRTVSDYVPPQNRSGLAGVDLAEIYRAINHIAAKKFLQFSADTEKQAKALSTHLYNVYNHDKEFVRSREFGIGIRAEKNRITVWHRTPEEVEGKKKDRPKSDVTQLADGKRVAAPAHKAAHISDRGKRAHLKSRRNGHLRTVRTPWTDKEDKYLMAHKDDKMVDVAKHLHRPLTGVYSRMHTLRKSGEVAPVSAN